MLTFCVKEIMRLATVVVLVAMLVSPSFSAPALDSSSNNDLISTHERVLSQSPRRYSDKLSFMRMAYQPYINEEFIPVAYKRAAFGDHQIQARAMNQFKNCYFSPVQCVLLERRKRK